MRLSLSILRDDHAPVIALVAAVIRQYGTAALEWQPELLRNEIESDFEISLTDLQSDKIQAGFTVLTTDLFEAQWEVFKTVCHLLNNTPDSFEDHTQLEAEELATAIAHYRLLIGEDEEKAKFSDEVRAYAGVVFYHYGMSEPASIFPTALMPPSAVKADPTEKNEALSLLFNLKTKALQDYMATLIQDEKTS